MSNECCNHNCNQGRDCPERKLNNEPVALMTEYGIKPLYEGALQEGMFLYTHPAKTLTDEEMLKCAEGAGCVFDYSYKGEVTFISKNAFKRFVDAILRKAQDIETNI